MSEMTDGVPRRKRLPMTALSFAVCLILVAVTAGFIQDGQQYNPDESRAKLLSIGRALQLYRQEYGYLENVAERKTYSDAGLPPYMAVLIQPGHRWSTPNGIKDFQISFPDTPDRAPNTSHFFITYWPKELDEGMNGSMEKYYALRGEKLIVLGDSNGTPTGMKASGVAKVMALRLDGTVDVVECENNSFDLLKK
ncbi:MAG: hypothetical protein JSS66_00920 [Armatimonadetes bacterium]|nr:hypothetical protein [Armatimonadota bacterium]